MMISSLKVRTTYFDFIISSSFFGHKSFISPRKWWTEVVKNAEFLCLISGSTLNFVHRWFLTFLTKEILNCTIIEEFQRYFWTDVNHVLSKPTFFENEKFSIKLLNLSKSTQSFRNSCKMKYLALFVLICASIVCYGKV